MVSLFGLVFMGKGEGKREGEVEGCGLVNDFVWRIEVPLLNLFFVSFFLSSG